MNTKLARVFMLAVQLCLVALALVLVFLPFMRTPSLRLIAGALAVACIGVFVWRLRCAGAAKLSMTALWARARRDPSGANMGIGSLDLLAIFLGAVTLNLP